MSTNYTQNLGEYTELTPFRYWCQKVMPLVYDDSLSYYELLCKVVDYLNKTMSDVELLHTEFGTLYKYVHDYFDSLDVQEEINNKLDEMALNGTLYESFKKFLPFVCPEWFGAKGDGVTDDSNAFISALHVGVPVRLLAKTYLINQSLDIPKDVSMYGCNGGSKKTHVSTVIRNTKKLNYLIFLGESAELHDFRIECMAETGSVVITAKESTDYVETNAILENISIVINNHVTVGFDLGKATGNFGSGNTLYTCTVRNGVYGFRVRSADNVFYRCESDSSNTGAFISNYQNIFYTPRFYNSYVLCLNVGFANECCFYGGSFDQTHTDGRAPKLVDIHDSKDILFDGCRFESILKRPVYMDGENISLFNCIFKDKNAECCITRNADKEIINCAVVGTLGITDVNKLTNYSYKINVIQNFSNVLCNTDFVRNSFEDVPSYNIICKINGATRNLPSGASNPLYGVITRKKTSDYMTDELITNDGKAFYRFFINNTWQPWHAY